MAEILTGNVTLECLDNNKIVRIFTSSTFTDTEHERNYLMEKVYPKLKDIYSKKGYQFQVVDMRWGVRDESTYQHLTTELCLKELALCQKLSTGPNLVAFISHKYGWRPPPRIISKYVFEMFLEESKNTKEDIFLSRWYKQDNNRLDSAYILQPFVDIHSSDEEKKKRAEVQWWKEEYPNLVKIIRSLAKKLLPEEKAHIFLRSVTETEIRESVFKDNSVEDHCLWFKRTIKNIDHCSEEAKKFQENPNGTNENKESQNLLEKLKTEMSEKLGDNVSPYEIEWTEKGVDPENKEHSSYLEKLGYDFEQRLKELIERDIAKKETAIKDMSNSDKELYEEVLQHTLFCKEKCKYFVGRVDILEKIKDYVQGETTDPLIVHGKSGSGKTSIMAKAAMEISKNYGQAVIILRFIGTTLHSSDADSIMESIIRQIQHNYGYSEPISSNKEGLREQFHYSLEEGTSEKPLFVILDALDQQNVCNVNWLVNLEPLPPNTKLILSTLPEGNCLPQLKSWIKEESQFIEIGHLKLEDAKTIFGLWLKVNDRRLTEKQMEIILQAFEKCQLPLFLKLSFDIAKNWHSYSHDCEKDLKDTVRDNINNLFKQLEIRHGEILISHVLGYITLARNGISSQELEDVLSCDDDVLNDCLKYWTPPIRRLPPHLLFQILDDLREYLVYRGSDGIQVTKWYHRQFIEAAKEKYCSDQEKKIDLYSHLADYFRGRWAGNKKTFKFKDKNGTEYTRDCDRLVAKQPNKFGEKPNLRKLNNLPHLLVEAKMIKELKEEALLNFEFILTKMKATSIRETINDFLFARERFPQDETIRSISKVLILSRTALNHDLDLLPSQLKGRLPDVPEFNPLRIACYCRESAMPHFQSSNQHLLNRPDDQLLLRLQNDGGFPEDPFDLSSDKKIIVSASNRHPCYLQFWSFPDGDPIFEYHPVGYLGYIYQVQFCDDDKLVAVNIKDRIDFIFTKTASVSHSLEKKDLGFFHVHGEKKSLIIFYSRGEDYLIIRDIKSLEEKHRIKLSSEEIGFLDEMNSFGRQFYPDYYNFIQTAGSDKYVALLMKAESPKILAVNLQTGNVTRWDINQFYSVQRDHRGIPKPICNRIALCPNEDLLYLVGDKYLHTYNLLGESEDEDIWECPHFESDIGISINGQFVYCISYEIISVYDCQKRKKEKDIIAYRIERSTVCMIEFEILMARSLSEELCIWDCTQSFKEPGSEVTSPQVPQGKVFQTEFLPNCRYMLFWMKDKSEKHFIYVYDVSKDEIPMGFKLINFPYPDVCPISNTKIILLGHSYNLVGFDFEGCSTTALFQGKLRSFPDFIRSIKDGKEILTACKDIPDIRVYNTDTGRLVQRIKGIRYKIIVYISISKSGNIAVLCIGSGTEEEQNHLCIIDLNRYKLKYILKPEDIPSCSGIDDMNSAVAVSRDGTLLIVLRKDTDNKTSIIIWNIEQEKVQWELPDLNDSVVFNATFVRNDELVLTAEEGMIGVFSTDSGELLKKIDLEVQQPPFLILSPNENPDYFLSKQSNFLCLWSLDSFQKICTFETDQKIPIEDIKLSPNGDVILSGGSVYDFFITTLKYSKSNPDVFLQMEEIQRYKELGLDNTIELPDSDEDSVDSDDYDEDSVDSDDYDEDSVDSDDYDEESVDSNQNDDSNEDLINSDDSNEDLDDPPPLKKRRADIDSN